MRSQGTRLRKDCRDLLLQQITHCIDVMYCSVFDDAYVSNPYRPSGYPTAARYDYVAHHLLLQHFLHLPHARVESLDETNKEFHPPFPRRVHELVRGPLFACHGFLDEQVLTSFNREQTDFQMSLSGRANSNCF